MHLRSKHQYGGSELKRNDQVRFGSCMSIVGQLARSNKASRGERVGGPLHVGQPLGDRLTCVLKRGFRYALTTLAKGAPDRPRAASHALEI